MAEFENTLAQNLGIEEGKARIVCVEKEAVDAAKLPQRFKLGAMSKLNHDRRAEREFQKLIEQLKQPLPPLNPL
jgi:hypothetical protein